MAIQVQCKYCQTQFRAKEEWTGKRAKCRYCGRIIIIRKAYPGNKTARIPAPPSEMKNKSTQVPPPAARPSPEKKVTQNDKTSPPAYYEIKSPVPPIVPSPLPAASEKECVSCRSEILTLAQIEEQDSKRRRSAALGDGEYSYSFYKALCDQQGYKCAGCGRIYCERCLTGQSTKKANIESIVCLACSGKLTICR